MANLEMYPNLPGMLVEFKDGGSALRFDTADADTDSILLLGTATDGPILEPIAVDSSTVELIFGSDMKSNGHSNGATLVHAFKQAYAAGCRDIRCMRITGSKATLSLACKEQVSRDFSLFYSEGGDSSKLNALYYEVEDGATVEGQASTYTPYLDIESIFGGSVYNEGKISIEDIVEVADASVIGKKITITKPASKTKITEDPQVYEVYEKDGITLGELIDRINETNNVYMAKTDYPEVLASELQDTAGPISFTGGDDGIVKTKAEIFHALSGTRDSQGYIATQGAYQLLENYMVDYVCPVGVYADDVVPNNTEASFAYELALLCAHLTYRNRTTHGMIAMKPPTDTTLAGIQKHAKYLSGQTIDGKQFNNNWIMSTNGVSSGMDLGKYITIVAGPTVFFNHSSASLRVGNPAVLVAAYTTTLLPQTSITNKIITGTTGVKFNFSNAQANDIIGNRMVVLGTKYQRNGVALLGAHIIKGPTAARPGSEYANLSTIKVMKSVIDNVREAADIFIGEPNSTENRNALAAAIDKRLTILAEQGVVEDYSFGLIATANDIAIGQAKLELGVQAPGELNKITTVIGLV